MLPLISHLLPELVVNVALGITLLMAWRYDNQQPFTRWIGLAFLVNALWVPGYWLYLQGGWLRWAGIVLWSLQQALFLVFLVWGVVQLRGRHHGSRHRRWLVLTGIVLWAVLFGAVLSGPRWAGTATALFLMVVAVLMARVLWSGSLAEKVAAVFLLVSAAVRWAIPLVEADTLALQGLAVATARLGLGLSLLYACLSRAAKDARRWSDQLLRLTDASHQGVAVIRGADVVYSNPALRRIFHLNPDAGPLPSWDEWGVSSADRLMNEGRRATLRRGEVGSLGWEQVWTLADGARLHLRFTAWTIDWEGAPAEQVVVTDETSLHESAQRLMFDATHDRLTGTLNRLGMEELFRTGLQAATSEAQLSAALILVDIDRFSAINDALGFMSGDAFLKQVALRIATVLGQQDVLARISGDQFIVLQRQAHSREQALDLARDILHALRQPFRLDAMNLNVSASAGVAGYPSDGGTFDALLSHASLAVKRAKEAGRNVVRFFDDTMDAQLLDDVQMVNDLHDALRLNQFELFLQPVLDIHTGALVGAEALLRWRHPVRGMVPPVRFIPLAESTGLIIDIGAWVMEEGCRLLAAWQTQPTLSGLVLSVNVSATQFARGDVDQVLALALSRHNPPRKQLELEVTESALINEPEQFVRTLAQLRALGVRLAVDDFGTGYSNLSYLQRFEVDKLKIDQSFVRRLLDSEQDKAIVRAVIQLAVSLNLKTTAEGVEDETTLAVLASLGCDLAQGYHFLRPTDRMAFEQWCVDRALAGGRRVRSRPSRFRLRGRTVGAMPVP